MNTAIRLLLLLSFALPAPAANLRDPTQPPPAAQAAMAASASAGSASEPAAQLPRHLIVSNGRGYIVEHGQRYGVGDTLGSGATVARIEGDAVWLQDAQGTRRVPLYAGVSKRPAVENATSPQDAAAAQSMAKRTDRKQSSTKEAP